ANGMADVLDPDPVDRQTAGVGAALHVFDLGEVAPRGGAAPVRGHVGAQTLECSDVGHGASIMAGRRSRRSPGLPKGPTGRTVVALLRAFNRQGEGRGGLPMWVRSG